MDLKGSATMAKLDAEQARRSACSTASASDRLGIGRSGLGTTRI